MELPSIVNDINGCNEIIQNGINGIIIPPKNNEQLYIAMLLIYENKDLYKKLKLNSRESIKKIDQNLIWQLLKKEYETKMTFS